VASPVCSPSRCALITGQFPARWRITSYLAEKSRNRGAEMADFLDPKAPSLPRQLKSTGNQTAHFGKWHLGGGRDVTDAPKFATYGYDEHAGTYESPEPDPDITATNWIWSPKDKFKRWERTQFFVDKTLDFLRRNKDQSCFVNLWLDDVHSPWIPNAAAQNEKNPNVAKNLKPVIAEMDRQIGRLMDGLKRLGIDQRTLVIFTSDNGPYPHLPGRTVGYRGCKFSLYEGGVRLPFIARWPGVVPEGVTDSKTVLASVDMFPTLCKLADAELPGNTAFDGMDRSDALRGTPIENRGRPLMWEYGRNAKFFGYPKQPGDRSPNLAIRDKEWKLLVNTDGQGAELYDLSVDPSESKNVAKDHPEEAAQLQSRLLKWRRSTP
jgi:arylsulfatase A-like enzyme